MKHAWLLFILVILFQPVYAQDTNEEEKEKIQSLTDERRELLLFGIDNQVIELLDDLTEEKDVYLSGEVLAAYTLTRNPNVRTKIFEYFTEIDFRGAVDEALVLVNSYEDQPSVLLTSSIHYLTDEPFEDLSNHLMPLLDATDQETVRIAIKGIGLSGDGDAAAKLLEFLDDRDFESNLKPEIILALGELKEPVAVPRLIEILEDRNENSTWRRYACASLGKIGDQLALPVIEKVLFDDDSLLRSYAVGSLKYFSGEKVLQLLSEALKDSFWRVRVSAAQGLAEKQATEAVPILIFKAEKDPEMNVRSEAVRALGVIADSRALEALRGFYSNNLTPQPLRVLSAEILAEKDLAASLEPFKTVIDKHWGKDTTRILEKTAQILSRTESDLLESFYARFIDSGEMVIMIYGIRGIGKNNMITLKEVVEKLADEGNHRSIRKEALAALELLK
jgi:HEAT repeat protein